MNRSSRLGAHYQLISVAGEERVEAFVPAPLLPDPPVPRERLAALLGAAHFLLGRLDGIRRRLPDPELLLSAYVRKETVFSAQIEGVRCSLSQLLLFENQRGDRSRTTADLIEASSQLAALEHGLERLRAGFPLSNRLIREMHALLFAGGRNSRKRPGEFRASQVWIGGTRPGNAFFVPPPAELVPELMSDLDRFVHEETPEMSALVQAALIHVQFETIHPFLDGNGRTGRLLITLFLLDRGLIKDPLLYLSRYFRFHRPDYYRRLNAVRTNSDWEGWVRFFLEGVVATCQHAVTAAERLLALLDEDRARVQAGRSAVATLRVLQLLSKRSLVAIPTAARELGLSQPTAGAAMRRLEALRIVREVTGGHRNRIYAYRRRLQILEGDTE